MKIGEGRQRYEDAVKAAEAAEILVDQLKDAMIRHHASLPDAKAVARACGVSVSTVRRWRKSGLLPAVPLGCACVRFAPEEVARAAGFRKSDTAALIEGGQG